MTSDGFAASVDGVDGFWPAVPETWSYTSLRNAQECPRRWSLLRATYPTVWTQSGYPPRPILPALVGNVIHRMLELILQALYQHRCQSLADGQAVAVLKGLGGYSGLASRLIDDALTPLESNPRIGHRVASLRSAMQMRIPDIRQRVQALIARTELTIPRLVGERSQSETAKAIGLVAGSHPEVELRAPELHLMGIADLITVDKAGCSIIDYKTGAADPHHADQLKTYALLWQRDRTANPDTIPVTKLLLSYATHEQLVEAPTDNELKDLAHTLTATIGRVEAETQLRPPPARPALAICTICAVRHLCDDCWSGPAAQQLAAMHGEARTGFIDSEATVVRQNGPRSWMIDLSRNHNRALLRTPTESPGFAVGDTLRLLDLAVTRDEDTEGLILTMTAASEVYRLRSAQASSSQGTGTRAP